jgi:hypothetical protein
LTNNLIKNRHNGISFAILAQSVRSIPKNIRLNCNVFFVGKFASKKVVLEDLYEEVSNVLTLEEFEELYDKAIATFKEYLSARGYDQRTVDTYLNKPYTDRLSLLTRKTKDNKEFIRTLLIPIVNVPGYEIVVTHLRMLSKKLLYDKPIRFVVTKGKGHNLKSIEVQDVVANFLEGGRILSHLEK